MFSTEGAIDSANDAMSEMNANKMDDVSTKLTELGRSFETEIVQPIANVVMPIIGEFADWCTENFDVVKGVVLGVGGAFLVLAGYLAITGLISAVSKAFAVLNIIMAANPVLLVVLAIAALVGIFIYLWNTCEPFREFWTDLWDKVKGGVLDAWETIKGIPEFIGGVFSEIGRRISEWWTGFKESFGEKWEEIKGVITEKWESIKTTVSEGWETFKSIFNWENIKETASTKWEEIKTSVGTKLTELGTNISEGWEGIKTTAGTKWDELKGSASTKWEEVKTAVGTKVVDLSTNLGIAWDNIKTTASTKWEEVKSFMQDPVGNAATAIGGFLTDIGLDFSGFDTSGIETLFKGVQDFMEDPIENAKTFISGIIEDIKGLFDFEFTWPTLKLPHITYELIEVPVLGSIPNPATLSVSWYASGGVLTDATIFGMGPNGLLGGGEYAGARFNPEIVTPQSIMADTFNEVLADRLAAQGSALANEIAKLGDGIVDALSNMGVYMDSKAVGNMVTGQVNRNMGRLAAKGGL